MDFGGLQKTSLIDFPGRVSCVLFLSGCNYYCPYCHNPDLAKGNALCPDFLTQTWFYDFLKTRKEFLDGVVISGGEPTLQQNLLSLCRDIKDMGYLVKLDTNGSQPQVIKELIEKSLVDFIAMDIKTDPDSYAPLITHQNDSDAIQASIRTILASNTNHEFRTTCIKPLVDKGVIEKISQLIKGAMRYCLQQFYDTGVLDPEFFQGSDCRFTKQELSEMKKIAAPQVKACIIR